MTSPFWLFTGPVGLVVPGRCWAHVSPSQLLPVRHKTWRLKYRSQTTGCFQGTGQHGVVQRGPVPRGTSGPGPWRPTAQGPELRSPVRLGDRPGHLCGGFVVRPSWVLPTASGCVQEEAVWAALAKGTGPTAPRTSPQGRAVSSARPHDTPLAGEPRPREGQVPCRVDAASRPPRPTEQIQGLEQNRAWRHLSTDDATG